MKDRRRRFKQTDFLQECRQLLSIFSALNLFALPISLLGQKKENWSPAITQKNSSSFNYCIFAIV